MLALLLMAQSTVASVPESALAPLPAARRDCLPQDGDELVVCGRAEEQSAHRLKPLPPRFERPLLPKAQAKILGGSGSIEAEQADVGGTPSRRAMIRMKWKF